MPGEMANPPGPGPGTEPAPPSKTTWSAVVTEGKFARGQNLDANSAARKRINISSGAQPIKKFSTYAILNGGACNMDDKPAKLVSVHPGSYYVGFDIPKTCAENELYKALDSLDMPLSVHLDKKTSTALVESSSEDTLAIFNSVEIRLDGCLLEPRRIIPCEADMTILSLSKVNTVDVAAATRSIADALQGYGTIRDILFQGGKRVFSQTVMVLFKRNSGVTLPSHILIEGRHIHLAGRHVEPSCTYCKKEGHFIGKCPRLARLKKRATTVEAKSGPAKKPNQSTSEASASTSAPRANSTRAPVSISAKGKQSQAQITSDLETPPAKPLKRARRTATVSIADLVYTDRATPLLPTKPHPEEAKAAAGKCAEADADASDVGWLDFLAGPDLASTVVARFLSLASLGHLPIKRPSFFQ